MSSHLFLYKYILKKIMSMIKWTECRSFRNFFHKKSTNECLTTFTFAKSCSVKVSSRSSYEQNARSNAAQTATSLSCILNYYHIQQEEQKHRATIHINSNPGDRSKLTGQEILPIIDPDTGEIIPARVSPPKDKQNTESTIYQKYLNKDHCCTPQ